MSNVDIYTILSSKPHDPYFLFHYYNFILTCGQANLSLTDDVYTERHHICPKAKDLFPEYKSFSKFSWNKINLTADQHFIAHKLLWKTYGKSQSQAFYKMQYKVELNREYPSKTISAIEFRKLREAAIKNNSGKREMTDEQRKQASERTKGKNNGMFGKHHSKDTIAKFRKNIQEKRIHIEKACLLSKIKLEMLSSVR